jgi:F-type H+-transporting ATPase subunit b
MENLGIDFKLLIAQIINFGLFYLIYKKYISKPFTDLIKEEQINEDKKKKLSEQLKEQEEDFIKKDDQLKNKLLQIEDKAFTEIKNKTELLKKDILDKAELEALKIKEKAKKEIEYEKRLLHEEVKNKIISTSMLIIKRVFGEILDEDIKKKYTDFVIKNLPKTKYEN